MNTTSISKKRKGDFINKRITKKRKISKICKIDTSIKENCEISFSFIDECKKNFNEDISNIIAKNAIVMMGSELTTIDSSQVNKLNHIFINTLKKKNLKATNQGQSGRCWLFGGLNIFRHYIIKALNLSDFEFSEVNLFFWDKFERSNTYLSWFINNKKYKVGDREYDYFLDDFMSDGGYWIFFVNLIKKYGVIPKSVMKETFQSNSTGEMNKIIQDRLNYCINIIRKDTTHKINLIELKNQTMNQIFNILVKFLGEPPQKFDWAYTDENNDSTIISGLTPETFTKMVIPEINFNDFVVLSDSPTEHLKYKQLYGIKYSSNIVGGNINTFLNIQINEITKYAVKSITSGMPVWFAADVSQDFNPYFSTLDDKMNAQSYIFGEINNFTKGDRITLRNIKGNHAMCITGVNLNNKGIPTEWQVENSWGYLDNETEGDDGWLTMSHSWFEKYVSEIVIYKTFLNRTISKLFDTTPIMLDPWNSVSRSLKVTPFDSPKILDKIKFLKNIK